MFEDTEWDAGKAPRVATSFGQGQRYDAKTKDDLYPVCFKVSVSWGWEVISNNCGCD